MINYDEIYWWHVFSHRFEEYFGRIIYFGKRYKGDRRKVIVTTEQKSFLIYKLIKIDCLTYRAEINDNEFYGNFIIKELPNFVKTINNNIFFEIEQEDIEKIYLSKKEKEKLNKLNIRKEDLIGKYYNYEGNIYHEEYAQMIYLNLRFDSLKQYNWKNIKKIKGT